MSDLCANKDVCGSCGWSHIPYPKQIKQKLSDINGTFALQKLDIRCEQIVPAPETSHYRDRMDFVIDFEGRVGMRQKGKWWRVVDNNHCFLADERIEELFNVVRQWSIDCGLTYFDRKRHHGLLRYAVIRTTSTGQSMITIVTSAPADAEEEKKAQEALEVLSSTQRLTTLIWSINHTITDVSFGDELRIVYGPGYIEEVINSVRYRITPNAFFQTNPRAAAILQNTVLEFAGDVSESTVVDLYCGSGFLTLPLAQRAKKVIGVEVVPEAIVDAKVNAELNSIEAEFHTSKTEESDWMQFNPDVLILDPPRSGMHDSVIAEILEHRPKKIVYVSCNYKHFAREMVKLGTVYNVIQMKAIDMFPHTPHVELVSVLVLR